MAPSASITRPGYLPEIQGLRALAAILVAVYHIWFGRVSGGVDVFFVVSGFLITRSLIAQAEQHGQVQFLRFGTSLARRLLPAAMVVLLATTIAAMLWLPTTQWIETIKAGAAALAYVENWHLALNATDYLAATQEASPFQHYWALSMQGQFYAAWAVLVSATALLAKLTGKRFRQLILPALISVFCVSLLYSIHATATHQAFAYFNTFARTWEFALGGLVALLLPLLTLGVASRLLLGWLGLVLVVTCGMVLQVSTVFPGYAALWPTLAASMILVAGSSGSPLGADRLLASRPAMFLGDLSYALYLWHWPVLVFYLVLADTDRAGLADGLGILALSIVLAWLTTRFIEKPIHTRLPVPRKIAPTLAFALTGCAPVVIALALWSNHVITLREQSDLSVDIGGPRYPGALALADPMLAMDAEALPVYPGPFIVNDDRPDAYTDGCHQTTWRKDLSVCIYGNRDGARTLALVGDSHAAQWLPALQRIAERQNWAIVNLTKAACWFNLDGRPAYEQYETACRAWNREAMEWLTANRPDAIVTMGTVSADGEEYVPAGFIERWSTLGAHGIEVIAIRDNPRHEFNPATCVDVHGRNAERCATPRESALAVSNPAQSAGELLTNVTMVDLSSYFCDTDTCFPVAGNILIYRDTHHLTTAYAETLSGPLEAAMQAGLPALFPERASAEKVLRSES